MEKKEYKKMRWEDPKLNYFDRTKSTRGVCEAGSGNQPGCAEGVTANACANGGDAGIPVLCTPGGAAI